MEAVKKLPMISFELKNSPEPTSFHNLKQVTTTRRDLIKLDLFSFVETVLIAMTHPVFVLLFHLHSASLSIITRTPTRTPRSSVSWSNFADSPSDLESTSIVAPPSSATTRNSTAFKTDSHCRRRTSCWTLHGRTASPDPCGAAAILNTRWLRFSTTSPPFTRSLG